MDVETQLANSASSFARSALQALPSGEYATFALHAGTALEHLAKALLARRHPALIAAGDFDSLLHACGESGLAKKRMRTINATVSIERAARFVPSIGNLLPRLATLAEARNGVAHLGEAKQADELRVPFLKASEALREELGLDRERFWVEFGTLVDAALEESVQEAKVNPANAVAAARVTFQDRYGHFDEEAKQGAFRAIEAGYDPEKYEEQIVDCPACESPALASGTFETRYEEIGDDNFEFVAEFFPGHLRCRACDLELDGDDELHAAGIDPQWEIEVDEGYLYGDWEPEPPWK
jgi:hypothetical protein